MALYSATLSSVNDRTPWTALPRGLNDIGLAGGLTGETVVLEYRISQGSGAQMYDKDGVAYSWTGPFNATIEVAGTAELEYSLKLSAVTSGSAVGFIGK